MILTVVVLASVLASGCYSYTKTVSANGQVEEEATGILASPAPAHVAYVASPCRGGYAYDPYSNLCRLDGYPHVKYRPYAWAVRAAGYKYHSGYGYYYRPYRHHHHRVVRTTRVVHRPKVVHKPRVVRHSPQPRPRYSNHPRRTRPRR